jgi:hypothetical protein
MKVLDALLMKLGEEFAELASAAGATGQLTSKAVRFGLDSYHPDDANRTTNAKLIDAGIGDVFTEMNDVLLFNWLIFFYTCRSEQDVPVPVFLTSTTAALSQAVVKLDRYMRYSDVMVKTGSMSSAEHAELVACVTNAKARLMSFMKEPFVL